MGCPPSYEEAVFWGGRGRAKLALFPERAGLEIYAAAASRESNSSVAGKKLPSTSPFR
jgi:hypothetical protein